MADRAEQKLIMVTGKGGVGKSLAAAALASKYEQAGLRVLLVELGEESFYKDFFGLKEVSYQPTRLRPHLDVALWSSGECLREYALHLLKSQSLYQIFFENRVMKTFIKVAPGLTELAILGKFTSGIRRIGPPLGYDVVVLDSYASGHTTALLRAPRGMADAVSFGPMGEQSRRIQQVLKNPEVMEYYVVTLPEELPYQESLELIRTIEDETGLVPQVIFNRSLRDVLDEEVDLESIPSSKGLGRFLGFLQKRLDQQRTILQQLQEQRKKIFNVPLITETDPWTLVDQFAERLK